MTEFTTEIVKRPILLEKVEKLAQQQFGDFVKAVVDVEQMIMAIGGEMHADQESVLLDKGSLQDDLWGINLHIEHFGKTEFIEFDSMINIRPRKNNRTRGVEDPKIQEKIQQTVLLLIKS